MRRPNLERVLRIGRRAVDSLAALAPGPVRVEDAAGKLLAGDAKATGERHPISASGVAVGAVVGPPAAAQIARVIEHMMDREVEKLALADETLGRYKELTLLYDIGDKLARVLDVDEVARLVVVEAQRFLKASSATLLVADRRRAVLEPLASTDAGASARAMDASAGVEGRVLETGRAEFVEDASAAGVDVDAGVCAVLCAPLRSGETVFGILRVTSREPAAWNAGHLKLVSSLASNAGAAISHARLHGERLRQQGLRHQISRFASPVLLDAAFQGCPPPVDQPVAALFCDVGEIARFADEALEPDAVLGVVRHATSIALDALMGEGAVVQISDDELLVGLFSGGDLAEGAAAAVRAARKIVRALGRRFDGIASRSPGVAVTHAVLPASRPAEAFFLAVGQAANLQRRAEGRILVDARVSAALAEPLVAASDLIRAPGAEDGTVYEVPA